MERTLVAVESHAERWRVSLVGEPEQTHQRKIVAVEAATRLACYRHRTTGERTGVCIHVGEHNIVMIGLHG